MKGCECSLSLLLLANENFGSVSLTAGAKSILSRHASAGLSVRPCVESRDILVELDLGNERRGTALQTPLKLASLHRILYRHSLPFSSFVHRIAGETGAQQ